MYIYIYIYIRSVCKKNFFFNSIKFTPPFFLFHFIYVHMGSSMMYVKVFE